MKEKQWNRWAGWLRQKGKGLPWAVVVIAVGVILLCLPKSSGGDSAAVQTVETEAAVSDYDVSALEEKLAQALGEISGVGEARVVLTVKSGTRQIYATETAEEVDGDGGRDSQETVARISTGSNSQQALEVMEVAPTFQGALVVCDGGNNPTVKLAVTESVAALTGLTTDHISVCGRGS